ncbi:MAG: hypothetical protein AAF661_05160 [Pseudomonadota bacterium]
MRAETVRKIDYPWPAKVLIPMGWALTVLASSYGAMKEAAASGPIAYYGLGALAFVVACSAIMASAYAAQNYANKQFHVAAAGVAFAMICSIWNANNHLNAFNNMFAKNEDQLFVAQTERQAILAEPKIIQGEIDALTETLAAQRETLRGAEALVLAESQRGGCREICQQRINERDSAGIDVNTTVAALSAAREKWRAASEKARNLPQLQDGEIAGARSATEQWIFKWFGVGLIEGIILASGWLFGIHRSEWVDPTGATVTAEKADNMNRQAAGVSRIANEKAANTGGRRTAPPPKRNAK